MTRSRRINDIFLILREWKTRRREREGGPVASGNSLDVDVTALVGDVSGRRWGHLSPRLASAVGTDSMQALGFQFGDPVESVDASEVEIFSGSRFPGFCKELSSALTKIAGSRLVVLTPDLPGLGLGLLANYHFGHPLVFIGEVGTIPSEGNPDWGDPAFLDPVSEAWKGFLAPYAAEVPLEKVVEGVLPVAERFAGEFAEFYKRIRG
jgi:hypothetical protein